jgi:hypothetical protein
MAEIGTEQASSAAAPAVTPGAQQGPVKGGGDLAEAMLAMSAKFDALVGALTGIATATTGARRGGQGGIGLANEAGLEDANAEATTALMESHSRICAWNDC